MVIVLGGFNAAFAADSAKSLKRQAIVEAKKAKIHSLQSRKKILRLDNKKKVVKSRADKVIRNSPFLGTWDIFDSTNTLTASINIVEVEESNLGKRFLFVDPSTSQDFFDPNDIDPDIDDVFVGFIINNRMVFDFRTQLGVNSLYVFNVNNTGGSGLNIKTAYQSCSGATGGLVEVDCRSDESSLGSGDQQICTDNQFANATESTATISKRGFGSAPSITRAPSSQELADAQKLVGAWKFQDEFSFIILEGFEVVSVASSPVGVKVNYFLTSLDEEFDPEFSFDSIDSGDLIGFFIDDVLILDKSFIGFNDDAYVKINKKRKRGKGSSVFGGEGATCASSATSLDSEVCTFDVASDFHFVDTLKVKRISNKRCFVCD